MRSENIEGMCSGTHVYSLGSHAGNELWYDSKKEMKKDLFTHWILKGKRKTLFGWVEEEQEDEIYFLEQLGAVFSEVQDGYYCHGCRYFALSSSIFNDTMIEMEKSLVELRVAVNTARDYTLEEEIFFVPNKIIFRKSSILTKSKTNTSYVEIQDHSFHRYDFINHLEYNTLIPTKYLNMDIILNKGND